MDLLKVYIKKRKGAYLLSVILALVGVGGGFFAYIYMAKIIGLLLNSSKDLEVYRNLCLAIGFSFIIKEIGSGLSTSISHKATFDTLADIRKKLTAKLFRMPLGDIKSMPSGELKNIIVEQVDSMETSLAHLVPEFTANLIGPLVFFAYMFSLDWRLSLLSLVPFVLGMSIMMSVMNDDYKHMFKKSVAIGQRMNSSVVEYINGIEVIKTFNQADGSYKKYRDAILDNAQFYYDWMGEAMNRVAIGRLLSPMGLLMVLPFGIVFYLGKSLELVDFISLIVLSFATVSSILKVMNYMDDMSRISTITGQIEKILGSRELINSDRGKEPKNYDIEFEDVSFSYSEDKKALDGISLTFKENSVSALVGPSGSGKSTIAKLIAGFWNQDLGSIKIGGVDTKDLSLRDLSSLVSFVSQDNFLFDMSIMENIRIANKNASDDEIIEVCKKSACHDFIMGLSQGYGTRVGEGGSKLSGGERQRISIARAMLKDSPIVILDEATSYIDPENEALIQNALKNLVRGKTLIVIAHRLKTITDADNIFVIKDGRLDSQGRHKDLVKKSSLYKAMYEANLRGDD